MTEGRGGRSVVQGLEPSYVMKPYHLKLYLCRANTTKHQNTHAVPRLLSNLPPKIRTPFYKHVNIYHVMEWMAHPRGPDPNTSYLEREAGLGEGLVLGQETSAHRLNEVGVSAGVGNVTSSMRQKIISHKYVDLKILLLPNEKSTGRDKRQCLVAEGGRITLGPDPHNDDLSVNGWTKTFALRRSVHRVSDGGTRHYQVYVHGGGFDIKGPGKGMERIR